MKNLFVLAPFLFLALLCPAQKTHKGIPVDWPVLKEYDTSNYENIAMPVGGIGTGTISFGGRGDLRDWELMNRPAIGFTPVSQGISPGFILTANINGKSIAKLLEGPLALNLYGGYDGPHQPNHNLPRFSRSTYWATYPFAQVNLSDSEIPLDVAVETYNPLIPGKEDLSGLPVMALVYKVKNKTKHAIKVTICGSIPNFIGNDGWGNESKEFYGYPTKGEKKNKNVFKTDGILQGIFMYSDSVKKESPSWGTMALTTLASKDVTYQSVRNATIWYDLLNDGKLTIQNNPISINDAPVAALALLKEIAPGETVEFPFFITWHFPNKQDWEYKELIGNYYTNQYVDAWDAACKIIPALPALKKKTVEFVTAFVNSSYPDVVKEAALFNLSTLRSQVCFRTPNGYLYGWEGTFNRAGFCEGNSNHVYNYEQTTPFLFGNLSKTMRISEFKYATRENGFMSARVRLPLETKGTTSNLAAADGQMGCIMKLYRDWQLSGDDKMLNELWPMAKKALAFAWIKGGWDADKDGVMEGCQHNTMDIEYFGPNPLMEFIYLGALRAAQQMAEYQKDTRFAKTCDSLFTLGSKYADVELFNGEYYIQKIMPSPVKEDIFPGLYMNKTNFFGRENPPGQQGIGCLIDQVVGQYHAHLYGLGYLAKKENIQSALQSVLKYNYKPNTFYYFNDRRSFRLGNEPGIIMCDYKNDDRSEMQMGYSPETMTGFEYAAATSLIYEGKTEQALKIIKDIRFRYDGIKRSPFHEAEAGYHYARAMAAWSPIIALSNFHYSGVTKSMSFTSKSGNYFWSNGYAWGTCKIKGKHAVLEVLSGEITLNIFSIDGIGTKNLNGIKISEGENFEIKL